MKAHLASTGRATLDRENLEMTHALEDTALIIGNGTTNDRSEAYGDPKIDSSRTWTEDKSSLSSFTSLRNRASNNVVATHKLNVGSPVVTTPAIHVRRDDAATMSPVQGELNNNADNKAAVNDERDGRFANCADTSDEDNVQMNNGDHDSFDDGPSDDDEGRPVMHVWSHLHRGGPRTIFGSGHRL